MSTERSLPGNLARDPALWMLAALLVVTVAAYWPGLNGGFVFDDFPNIVQNSALHLEQVTLSGLWQAAWSGQAGPLARPVAMASFALEWGLFGGDPGVMKATNLAIHLLNGLLVFGLARALLAWVQDSTTEGRGSEIALAVAAVWLLNPINLTSVLLVVQRMESLAALCTLAGLLAYTSGRQRLAEGQSGGWWRILLGLLGGTGVGVLVKESAVLTPLYALILEWGLFRLRSRDGQEKRRLLWLFAGVLLVPGLLGLAWLMPGILSGAAYENRTFDLGDRLWTQARVMWHYMSWILLPHPGVLSLYHDDIVVSRGPFSPISGLVSAIGLVLLLVAALILRRRRPLVAVGVLWFLGGHLLVSTVLPLELVHEHRNYLPGIGLILAVVGTLLAEPRLPDLLAVRRFAVVAVVVLFALFTGLRAGQWADPLKLAVFESARHPESPRAQYELGLVLAALSQGRDSMQFSMAMAAFQDAASLEGSGIAPDQALILTAARHGAPVDAAWWARMRQRLAGGPLSAQDVNALYSLVSAQASGEISLEQSALGKALRVAVEANPRRADVVTLYANFAANVSHNLVLAERLMQRAVALAPGKPQMWKNLVRLQIHLGQHSRARVGLDRLRELNRFGTLDADIATLEARLGRHARAGGGSVHALGAAG